MASNKTPDILNIRFEETGNYITTNYAFGYNGQNRVSDSGVR